MAAVKHSCKATNVSACK